MFSIKPSIELPGYIRGRVIALPCFNNNTEYLDVLVVPDFPCVALDVEEKDICWDMDELIQSCQKPGAYQLLNAGCGVPDDVDIKSQVFVSYPDDDVIVWEIDVLAMQPALADEWRDSSGFIRLVFQRKTYEAEIRLLLKAVFDSGTKDCPVKSFSISDDDYCDRVRNAFTQAVWPRKKLFHDGDIVEIGCEGKEIFFVNGYPCETWPTHFFTRWELYRAFNDWLAFVTRGWCLWQLGYAEGVTEEIIEQGDYRLAEKQNCFFLLHEHNRPAYYQAGQHCAQLFRDCMAEGNTANIAVYYRVYSIQSVLD